MSRWRLVLAAALLVAAASAALVGCSSAAQEPVAQDPAALEANPWQVKDLLVEGTLAAPAGAELTLTFAEGRASGSGGCNSFVGEFATTDPDGIDFGALATTQKACALEIMDQEQAYLDLLDRAAAYRVSADSLELVDAEGETLITFVPGAAPTLTGVDWNCTAFNNGKEAVVGLMEGTEITALFAEDGKLSGNATINQYNAEYTLEGKSLTIGAIATTKMAGDELQMQQEAQYLAALARVESYRFEGDRLVLISADGARQAEYLDGGTPQ